MKNRAWIFIWMLLLVAGTAGIAAAELTVVGTATYQGKAYNLIYESDQELIWLDYYQPQQPFGIGWFGQVDWAADLNRPGELTYSFRSGFKVTWEGSWRLPMTVDGPRTHGFDGTTTTGFNITTSEMGHLFYASLGNKGYYDKEGNVEKDWDGMKNRGPFENLRADSYWSGTEHEAEKYHAYDFNMYFGSQNNMGFTPNYMYAALAVRPAKIEKN